MQWATYGNSREHHARDAPWEGCGARRAGAVRITQDQGVWRAAVDRALSDQAAASGKSFLVPGDGLRDAGQVAAIADLLRRMEDDRGGSGVPPPTGIARRRVGRAHRCRAGWGDHRADDLQGVRRWPIRRAGEFPHCESELAEDDSP